MEFILPHVQLIWFGCFRSSVVISLLLLFHFILLLCKMPIRCHSCLCCRHCCRLLHFQTHTHALWKIDFAKARRFVTSYRCWFASQLTDWLTDFRRRIDRITCAANGRQTHCVWEFVGRKRAEANDCQRQRMLLWWHSKQHVAYYIISPALTMSVSISFYCAALDWFRF